MSGYKPHPVVVALSLVALANSLPVSAEPGHRCAAVKDSAARLACYDAEFGKPSEAAFRAGAPPAAAAAVPSTSSADTGSKARDEFGLSEADRRALDPEKSAQPQKMTDAIASIGRRPTGEMIFTLRNGQVWTQIEAETRSRVKVGDEVTIRKGSLGSFLLVGPDRIAVRVRRVK